MNNDDFNKSFNHVQKMTKRGIGVFVVLWIGALGVGCVLAGALVYVAIHFLQKVW